MGAGAVVGVVDITIIITEAMEEEEEEVIRIKLVKKTVCMCNRVMQAPQAAIAGAISTLRFFSIFHQRTFVENTDCCAKSYSSVRL